MIKKQITPLTILLVLLSICITGAIMQNITVPVQENITENITICKSKDSLSMEEQIYLYLDTINVKFKTVVVAQAVLESGNFKSKVFKENNNIFGMKKASTRPTLGTMQGSYSKYKNWQESILDYAFYQAYFCNRIKSEEEYINHLCTNYAEDEKYRDKLERIIAKLRNTNSLTKS
jgi:uncharacterized FlgJ-related protein